MKYLSLVFDDGPSHLICEMADKIKSYGWSAGFAIIGRKINKDTLDMLQYVIDNGFQIISHGQEHLDTRKLSSADEIKKELILPIETLEKELGYKITMARLPYLSKNSQVLEVAKELELPLLGHGINGGDDWDTSVGSDKITEAVLDSVCDGAIGCLHALEHTNKALDVILPELKKRDFCLLTPEDLFLKKSVTPPFGIQIDNVNDFLT